MRKAALDRISRRQLCWGAASLLASIQYSFAEALTAEAWAGRPYSYLRDYISDLGVSACLGSADADQVCSPLAWLMNTSFVLQGLLFIASTVVLAPVLPSPTWRRTVLVLGLAHGVGTALVGFFPAVHDGLRFAGTRVHIIGAYLAIAGGNLAIMAAGWGARDLGARPWFVALSLILGVVGTTGALLLLAWKVSFPGLLERIAADAVTVWTLTAGVLLAGALVRRAPATMPVRQRS